MYEPARSPRSYQQSTVLPPHPDDLGNLSEPTPHQYVQAAHSGHSNPLYDQRQYPVGPSSCSPSGATRSPPQHCPVGQGPGPHYHTIHEGSNGGSYGLPMPSYDEQAHPLPSAHHHDYNPSPVSSAPRKGHRAQLACDTCRKRKAKCDESRPICSFCRENERDCVYNSVVAPVKADRIAGRILDELSAISHEAEVINNRLDRMERAILQRRLSPVTSSTNKRGNGHLIESQQNQETKVKKLRKKPDPRHVPEVTRETRAMDSSQGPHGSLGPGTSMPIWKGEVGGQGRIATSDYGMKGCLTEEVDSSGANEIFTALFYGDREWENFVKFHS